MHRHTSVLLEKALRVKVLILNGVVLTCASKVYLTTGTMLEYMYLLSSTAWGSH